MKRILIGFLILIVAIYFYSFVIPKTVKNNSELAITNNGKNKVYIELTDSYYFITNISEKYSKTKDTLYIECKKSTLANIFYSNKLGYKIIDVDINAKVITYCGVSVLIKGLYPSGEESLGAIPINSK